MVPDLNDLLEAGVDHIRSASGERPVIMNLRTGAAGTRLAHFPEVILLGKLQNVSGINVRDFLPDGNGLVIILIDCRPQPLLGQAPDLGEQFPAPADRLALVIIAEGPVSEHLEKGVVIGIIPDFLEIVMLTADPDALLAIGDAAVLAGARAEEDFLELVHSRIHKQQGGIRLEHHRGTGNDDVPLGLEIIQKRLPDFRRRKCCPGHSHTSLQSLCSILLKRRSEAILSTARGTRTFQ